jgi:putative sigma-54 modulation protein
MFTKSETSMKVHITSRHDKLTAGLKTHIEDKISRVERYLGQVKEAHVILNFEKKVHLCEVTLVSKNLKLSAKSSSRDMYQSIDSALQRLETQAQKQKDKRVGRHRPENSREASSVTHGVIHNPLEAEAVKVVRSKTHAVKPMSVEEAALQLAASKDEFLVFSNAETEHTNVVYKRKDNHIGLIEPEY